MKVCRQNPSLKKAAENVTLKTAVTEYNKNDYFRSNLKS